jgi:hypothetical protein
MTESCGTAGWGSSRGGGGEAGADAGVITSISVADSALPCGCGFTEHCHWQQCLLVIATVGIKKECKEECYCCGGMHVCLPGIIYKMNSSLYKLSQMK